MTFFDDSQGNVLRRSEKRSTNLYHPTAIQQNNKLSDFDDSRTKAIIDTTRRRHLAASAKRNAERIF